MSIAVTVLAGACALACGDGKAEKPATVALAAPVISINADSGEVSWQPITHATGYEVYIDDELAATVAVVNYVLEISDGGVHAIKVRAVTTEKGYKASAYSNIVNYGKTTAGDTPLSVPNAEYGDGALVWQAVPNADSYEVYVDGVLYGTVTASECDLTELAVGDHSAYVIAKAKASSGFIDSAPSDTLTFTVHKHALGLFVVSAPNITEYWLDEKRTALDLTGFSAEVRYSNAEPEPITLTAADSVVESYNLAVAGRYEVEFEKDGLFGAAFRIYVKERTKDDVADCGEVVNLWSYPKPVEGKEADEVAWRYDGDTYSVMPNWLGFTPTTAIKSDGTAVDVIDGAVAKSALGMGETLLRLTDGRNSAYVNVAVAREIYTVGGMASIKNDLNGYYRLTRDIDFADRAFSPIGNAPLNIAWNDKHDSVTDIKIDRSGMGDAEDEYTRGVPFTGVFDGCGYVISGVKVNHGGYSYALRYKGFAKGLFGYIGKSGEVRNVVLRNVNVNGMDRSALVAGCNEGIIRNITVEDSCLVKNIYWNGAIICAYDYGTVKNVVSFVEKGKRSESDVILPLLRNETAYSDNSGINGYVLDRSDLTSTLGAGWTYFDGYGTVFAAPTYKCVVASDGEAPNGGTISVDLLLADASRAADAYFHQWATSPSAAVSVVARARLQDNIFRYTLKLPVHTVGSTVNVKARITSDGLGYFANIPVKILAATVSKIAAATGVNVETVTGSAINTGKVPIIITYSDGTVVNGNPTGYISETYDSGVEKTQNVTFYYKDGDVYHYAVVPVTPKTPVGRYVKEITVVQKKNVGKIIYGTANPTVDFDKFLTFAFVYSDNTTETVTAEDKGITHSALCAGKNTVTFEYRDENDVQAFGYIELDIWFAVASAAEFAAINDKLDGYYTLAADIDFGNAAPSVGIMPMSGSEFDINDSNGNSRAFVGKFDGAGHTISGFKSAWSTGWTEDKFGQTLFNYIGVGGEVGNFTLENAVIGACNYAAFVAGCNRGKIYDVTVSGGTLFANYGVAGAFASYNYGEITNCTCDVAQYTKLGNASIDLCATYKNSGTVDGCTPAKKSEVL